MLHWRRASDVEVADVHPHPLNIIMVSFRMFDECPYFITPVDDQGHVQTQYFYCRLCRKWINISTNSGNLYKHVSRLHPSILTGPDIEPPDPVKIAAAKKFFLLNSLPFKLADDPNFKILCPHFPSRKELSSYASELSETILENVYAYLQGSTRIFLAIDEWTSAANTQYLGVECHALFPDSYEVICIEHKPIYSVHSSAELLAGLIFDLIKEYNITEQYAGFVSDTTAKMPAANAALNQGIESAWFPCFCHICDLILLDTIEASN